MSYCNLHTHTQYSNITTGLDSINKLEDLIPAAKKLGITGLCITEHDNLSGIMEINRWQKKIANDENDDFILGIGNEIYLIDEFDETNDKEKREYYHLILMAKNRQGLQAIIELSSKAWYRSRIVKHKRRVPTLKSDIEEIIPTYKGHLFCSTACLGSEFDKLVLSQEKEKADEYLKWLGENFGVENVYIELMPSAGKDQKNFNYCSWKWYGEDYPFIISSDAHYQTKEDFSIFEAFLRSKQETREVQEYYEFARLVDEEEIIQLMVVENKLPRDFVERALKNTEKIARQFKFYDLTQKQKIPIVQLKAPSIKIPEYVYADFLAEQVRNVKDK